MYAAVSTQAVFGPTFVLHAALLLEYETEQDALEDARIFAVNTARGWEEYHKVTAHYVTVNIHFGGDNRVAEVFTKKDNL